MNKLTKITETAQYLRWYKTSAWVKRQDDDTILKAINEKTMYDYPVDAMSKDDAEYQLDEKIGLRKTGMSLTDYSAIVDYINTKKQNK